MPAYHSKTSDTLLSRCKMVGNTPLLPIKVRIWNTCVISSPARSGIYLGSRYISLTCICLFFPCSAVWPQVPQVHGCWRVGSGPWQSRHGGYHWWGPRVLQTKHLFPSIRHQERSRPSHHLWDTLCHIGPKTVSLQGRLRRILLLPDTRTGITKWNCLSWKASLKKPHELDGQRWFSDISLINSRLAKCTTKHQGEQEMFKMALNKFSLPGEANFPLNDHFHRPASPEDTDELRRYMMQFRYAATASSLLLFITSHFQCEIVVHIFPS